MVRRFCRTKIIYLIEEICFNNNNIIKLKISNDTGLEKSPF